MMLRFPPSGSFFRTILGALALFLCLPFTGRANHIIGGEMVYRYIADLDSVTKLYEFTLVVYRDCDSGGAELDQFAPIAVYKGSLGGGDLIFDDRFPVEIAEVEPVIPACADVNQLPAACVQRGTYVFTMELKVIPDTSYVVVYQRCCRTVQIININDPLDYGATYMIEVTPEALAASNSSPVFDNYPPGFICNQFPLRFDHRATDLDGDSLAYEFCTPLNGGGRNGTGCFVPSPNPPCGPPFDTVVFIGNYTREAPMGGTPTIAITPDSGFISGKPNGIGQYVVGICVAEYRNGVLFSRVLRDFQFNVVDCVPAVVADVLEDSLMGQQLFLLRSCGKKDVFIKNQSPQNTAQLTIDWLFDLGNGNQFSSQNWDVTVPFPDYGTYTGILYLNTGFECADTGYLTVKVFPPMGADFSYTYDSCVLGPVVFQDLSFTEAAGGLTGWEWSYQPAVPMSLEQNPAFQFPAPALYEVKLVTTDINKCKDVETKTVPWLPRPLPDIPDLPLQNVCMPGAAVLKLFPTDTLPTVDDILWDFGDGEQATGVVSPLHSYDAPGTYTVSLSMQNDYGCADADTFENVVVVHPEVQANFDFGYDSCHFGPVTFFDRSTSGAGSVAAWEWTFGANSPQSGGPIVEHKFPAPDTYNVTLRVTDANDCSDFVTQEVPWLPRGLPDLGELERQRICLPDGAIFEMFPSDSVLTGNKFVWDFGDGERALNVANPTHFYEKPGIYTVSLAISNDYKCFATDTFEQIVAVYPSPDPAFEYQPTAISNLNNTVQFTDLTAPGDSVAVWVWDFGTGDGVREQSPIYTFPDTGKVKVQLTTMNIYGCQDSIFKILDIVPQIKIYIPNVFMPSALDGLGNERFGAAGVLNGYSNYNMRVWSRWGELLFESRDPNEGWDGRRRGNGKTMPPGTYLYEIWLTGPRGEYLHWEGTVTLL